MLVAPVVEKGATSRRVYLPAHRSLGEGGPRGSWYDFWTSERLDGGREIERAVDLGTMPLYVRAGAIVPMGPVKQFTSQQVDGPLTVTIYPGADGAFDLFEDDGRSFAYRQGDWMGLSMRWEDRSRRLTLALAANSRMRPPATRAIEVRVAGRSGVRRTSFSGRTVSLTL
jgi:alpha-glucosidase/alpha-D-xyloside xylohydrolase